MEVNSVSFRHSSRSRPLKLSTNAFWVGFQPALSRKVGQISTGVDTTCGSCDQRRIEADVSSVPLSLTTASFLPRIAAIMPSSRATLAPESDVSVYQRQAFAREIIHHAQNAETPTTAKGVRDKVQRPALVRPLWQRHWRPGPQRPFPAAARLPAHATAAAGEYRPDG